MGKPEDGAITKKQLARATRLYEQAWEFHQKAHVCLEEMGKVLRGERSRTDAIAALLESFAVNWAARYRSKYDFGNKQKVLAARSSLNRLLSNGHTEADLQARLVRFIKDDDEFLRRPGVRHGFELFVSRVNTYVGEGAAVEDLELTGDDEPAGVPGCRHLPRCKDGATHTDRVSDEMRQTPRA